MNDTAHAISARRRMPMLLQRQRAFTPAVPTPAPTWPVAVAVIDEDVKDPLEVASVENQQPVETFRAIDFNERLILRGDVRFTSVWNAVVVEWSGTVRTKARPHERSGPGEHERRTNLPPY